MYSFSSLNENIENNVIVIFVNENDKMIMIRMI